MTLGLRWRGGLAALVAVGLSVWWLCGPPQSPALSAAEPSAVRRTVPAGELSTPLPMPVAKPDKLRFDAPHGLGDSLLYGRHGRAVALGGQSVAAYVQARMPAARRGEPLAAYEAYQALALCAAEADASGTERLAIARACEGVSPLQVQERSLWLGLAAQAGLAEAQLDFYVDGRRSQNPALPPDDASLLAWKAEALAYLQRAAAQCHPFVLGLLSTLYDSGELAPADPAQALRYATASAIARQQPLRVESWMAELGSGLTEEQARKAVESGQRLAAEACPSRP